MWLRWRISGVWQKALYIALGWGITPLVLLMLGRTWLLHSSSWLHLSISFAVGWTFQIVGVRVFRGHLEPLDPPRSWWRWTGRPKAGFWLGSLNLLGALSFFFEMLTRHGPVPSVERVIVGVASSLIAAFGYLNSSFRLLRRPELWSQRRQESRYLRES
jgi:hypothetical protein